MRNYLFIFIYQQLSSFLYPKLVMVNQESDPFAFRIYFLDLELFVSNPDPAKMKKQIINLRCISFFPLQ